MAQEAGPVGAFPPPPGRTPNFDHPEDLGRTSLTVGLAIMAGFTTVMFGLRNYGKKTITSQWYTEDWTCIAAYGLWMLYISTVLVMAHYGEGYHEWEVTKEAYKEILRWLYVGSILYCPAAYFTKVTLLLLEARVFAVYEKVSRGVFIFITVLLICYVPIMLLKAVVCIPIAAAWDQDVKPANCLNQRKVFISDMCLGVLTDLVILILPLVLTFSLHMPIWTKIKVVALLGAGGVATGVSIYRLYKAILFLNPTDTTEGFVLLDITTALELAIGLVCACLPAIHLLVQRTNDAKEISPNRPRTRRSEARNQGEHATAIWYRWTKESWTRSSSNDTRSTSAHGVSIGSPTLGLTTANNNWGYDAKATSVDGRREGWLRQAEDVIVEGELVALPQQVDAIGEVHQDWEAAWNRKLHAESHASETTEKHHTMDIV